MKLWPFRKTEVRAQGLTDTLVTALLSRAAGGSGADALQTGALEACSGLVGRAFAAAVVKADENIAGVLTPACLSLIGRSLIRKGELVLYIDVDDMGGVRLLPCASHDITGGAHVDNWIYRCQVAGPSRMKTMRAASEGVIHLRYAVDPESPWRGVGPLQVAALAGRLSAELSNSLADESGGPIGHLLPVPVDGQDESVAELRSDLRKARGQVMLVQSGDWGNVSGAPTGAGWESRRIGPQPPAALVELQQQATNEVFAAVGLSPVLFAAQSAGNAAREAWRQALSFVIKPLGRLVEAELASKLSTPVKLDFGELAGSDLQVKSRAVSSLAGAGLDINRALRIAGLDNE